MAFTKAQYDEVKTFVENGQIENARRLLEDIDDEKARALLDKLNQRFPLTLADAKRLLGQQRYAEAEQVLWNLDDPEATTLLEKLTLVKTRMKATSTTPALSAKPVLSAAAPKSRGPSLWTIITVGGTMILIVLVVMLVQVIQQRQQPQRPGPEIVQAALKGLCIKLSRISPDPGDEGLTDEQIAADCGAAAQDLYEESPEVVNACYDIVVDKDDALEWTDCLMKRMPQEQLEDAQSF